MTQGNCVRPKRQNGAERRTVLLATKELHDDEASWSSRSRHKLVPDSTHHIQLIRPEKLLPASAPAP